MITLVRLAILCFQVYLAVNFGMLAMLVVAKAGWIGLLPAAAIAWIGYKVVAALERVRERLSDV